MLTKDEIKYLKKIPADKKVQIFSYDPQIANISRYIIRSIKDIYPSLRIIHLGAAALKISGQNDIDIYVLTDPERFNEYLPGLIRLFNSPTERHKTYLSWKFVRNGHDVEVYLTDANSETMKKQIKVFEILSKNEKYSMEYETLKTKMNGRSYREYQQRKYEFYHKILGDIIN